MRLKEMIDDLANKGKIEPNQLIAMQLQLAAEKHNVKELLDNLSDEERYQLIYNYCHGCGSKYRGCNCLRDE